MFRLTRTLIVAACCLLAPSVVMADGAYEGQQVVRVVPSTLRELRAAMTIANDVWTHSPAVGRPLDLQIDAASLASLRRAGFDPEVRIPDLAAVVAAEKARLDAEAQAGGVAGGDAWFADFKDLAAIEAKLDEFVAQRPDLVSPIVVGASLEGRTIHGVRISSAGPGAPAVLINGCQHAREWISPMTVMYIANQLVDNASSDAQIAEFLGRFEILVVPVVNPDGYQFTWDDERLWRKNRRNNGDGTFGVDLNRNWGLAWGGPGSSGSTSSETYRGTAPFSEPESAALRDFYIAHPNIIASIDFHSFGQLTLSPWGWTTDVCPDASLLDSIGTGIVDSIAATTGAQYVSGPIGSTLYLASGNVVDWAYAEANALAYTIELRDTGEFGFILPPAEILPTGIENMAAMRSFLEDLSAPASISIVGAPPVEVIVGRDATVDVRARELAEAIVPGSERLQWRPAGAGEFVSAPLAATEDPSGFIATLPALGCGDTVEWYVEAATLSTTVRFPVDAPASVLVTEYIVIDERFVDDFETDAGWTVGAPGDSATAGLWTRVDPNGTTAQPEHDASADGSLCFVTGQGAPGGAAGAADVDGGATTLTSPPLDCSDPESYVSYQRWYSNNLGSNPESDSMPIEISSDGGAWVQLELVTENANAWVSRSFRVADYVSPSSSPDARRRSAISMAMARSTAPTLQCCLDCGAHRGASPTSTETV